MNAPLPTPEPPAAPSYSDHTLSLALDYALRYSREVAVCITDVQGRTVWTNPASSELTGYSLEELLGKTPGQVLQFEGTDPKEVARLSRHIRAGSSVVSELLNRHKDGSEYWVRVEVLPARSPDGTLIGFVGLQTDVTEQVTHRRQRDQDRDQTLAIFSHEVRAPLNAVLNLLDLLLEAPLSPAHTALLQHAIEASASLKDLVVNVLENSRIAHLEAHRPLRRALMPDLLRQVGMLAQGYRRSEAVRLHLHCAPSIPPVMVRSDLLLRTLLNLVSNALKFTPSGSVTVRVEHDTHSSTVQSQVLRFSVTDTGIGIAPKDHSRVLKPYETVPSGPSSTLESTGLGLSLCERMLSTMGSSLRLYSVAGVGTTMSFELTCPAASEEALLEASVGDIRLDGMKVMLVDDTEINLLVTCLQLQRRGAEVVSHQDARVALEELFASGPDRFDVVLMDLQMPDLTGVDAVRRIRLQAGFEALPVLALSGEVDPGSVDGALAAGFVDFISKPFEASMLAAKLSAYRPLVAPK